MVILQNVPGDDALESEDGLTATIESTICVSGLQRVSLLDQQKDPGVSPWQSASVCWAK